MASFGALEAEGMVALIAVVASAVVAAKGAMGARARSREIARLTRKLDDFAEREEINGLRHRDFDAFLEKLNARRKRLGEPPLTKEYLLPQRFNLMYSVDVGDIDQEALESLKKRVEGAAKVGADPAAEEPKED